MSLILRYIFPYFEKNQLKAICRLRRYTALEKKIFYFIQNFFYYEKLL